MTAETKEAPVGRECVDAEPMTNGRAAAAYWSAGIGLLTMALVNLGTSLSKPFEKFVHAVGKAWMPGAQGIGPYSGKETFALVAWIGSWLILGAILRKREVKEPTSFIGFLTMLGVATTLFWPPVVHWIESFHGK